MTEMTPIKFRRTKGIVWVCDLAKSSSYLNNNDSVDEIEEYIPRLYYVSKLIVESYGGVFLKWTGDGFLAFFEVQLDRHKEMVSKKVFEAIWQLTFMSNVTQLGLKPKKKFKIRHGVTYEKDALLMNIATEPSKETLDIIGRAVVLAFRLSGIQTVFPSIVTVRELVETSNKEFKKWRPSKEEKLKFFKGESFGTETIFISSESKNTKPSFKSTTKKVKKAIFDAESDARLDPESPIVIFTNSMSNGPAWCKKIIQEEADFIKNGLLGTLKSVVEIIEKHPKKGL